MKKGKEREVECIIMSHGRVLKSFEGQTNFHENSILRKCCCAKDLSGSLYIPAKALSLLISSACFSERGVIFIGNKIGVLEATWGFSTRIY